MYSETVLKSFDANINTSLPKRFFGHVRVYTLANHILRLVICLEIRKIGDKTCRQSLQEQLSRQYAELV